MTLPADRCTAHTHLPVIPGKTLHVAGPDRAALEAAIAPYRGAPFTWREAPPTLEDVFIHLMAGASDEAA